MTSLDGSEELLKLDARGRVLISKERREALLDEFERSGMSGAQFARLAGIKYGTFSGWAFKRRCAVRERRSGPTAAGCEGSGSVKLVEAIIGEAGGSDGSNQPGRGSPGSGALRLDLPGGCRVWLESPVHLAMAAELVVLVAQAGGARC